MKICNIKRFVFFTIGLVVLSACETMNENDVYLIPEPAQVEVRDGFFNLNNETRIEMAYTTDTIYCVADYLKELLHRAYSLDIDIVNKNSNTGNAIVFEISEDVSNSEGYEIDVSTNGIQIKAKEAAGLFYGVQTLRQLLERNGGTTHDKTVKYLIPEVKIIDTPRFKWRGLHLDVSRHFFSVDFIKTYIDFMVRYKLNVFHWHLVDGPGWRIPIDAYPKLTEEGAWRVDKTDKDWNWRETEMGKPTDGRPTYGGYYSKDDIREIVQYAQERFVQIVPEIEMPGHSLPPLLSYPELVCENNNIAVEGLRGKDVVCVGREYTYKFFEQVLDETMELFPSKLIHIGGDEVSKTAWKDCRHCQALIKKESLKDEKELQSYFITKIAEYVQSKGREIIGWDEIMEGGLAKGAKVMSWRGMEGGIKSANLGHDVVMAPITHTYFDLYQGDPSFEPLAYGKLYLSDVYKFDPIPKDIQVFKQHHILGGHACLWTEHIQSPEQVEYMLFPRLLAFSETVWSQKENMDYNSFVDRVEFDLKRLDNDGINYSMSAYNVNFVEVVDSLTGSLEVSLNNDLNRYQIMYTLNGDEPSLNSKMYKKPITILPGNTIKAVTYKNGVKCGVVTERKISK